MLACAGVAQAQDCDRAMQLTRQAFDLGENPATFPEQKRLLTQALHLCPGHAEAHNNLAWVYGQEQNYEMALQHYQAAVKAKPDYVDAWYGLGDAYRELRQFPLSLNAYLHVCQTDKEARQKAIALLENNRYKVSEEGEILNKESLLLLYDPERRAELQRMLKSCEFGKAVVEPAFVFRNILFATGKASLKQASLSQLAEISAALVQIDPNEIVISGHTDKQGFKGVSDPAENARRNMQLSEDRADSVAKELARLGVPRNRMVTEGYGQTEPLASGDTEEAYAQNRRVTIEVK